MFSDTLDTKRNTDGTGQVLLSKTRYTQDGSEFASSDGIYTAKIRHSDNGKRGRHELRITENRTVTIGGVQVPISQSAYVVLDTPSAGAAAKFELGDNQVRILHQIGTVLLNDGASYPYNLALGAA